MCWLTLAASSRPLKLSPSTRSLKSHGSRGKERLEARRRGLPAQRYPQELAKELPEVDLFIGTGEVPKIVEILQRQRGGCQDSAICRHSTVASTITPLLASEPPSYTAFLKVSEGCDHKCAFCIIPQLRAASQSLHRLGGKRDRFVVTRRGQRDQSYRSGFNCLRKGSKDGTTLLGLLSKMIEVPEVVWIRLLYAYPNFLDEPLLRLIRESDKICNYIDIPFQHISPRLLQRMRRGKSGSAVRETVENSVMLYRT